MRRLISVREREDPEWEGSALKSGEDWVEGDAGEFGLLDGTDSLFRLHNSSPVRARLHSLRPIRSKERPKNLRFR
jgi:hypothetical protein